MLVQIILATVNDKTDASMNPNKKIKTLFICFSRVLRFEEGSLGYSINTFNYCHITYIEFFINFV
jgi:hypothetical protein